MTRTDYHHKALMLRSCAAKQAAIVALLLMGSTPLAYAQQSQAEEIANAAAAMAEKDAVSPSASPSETYRPAESTSWFEQARFGLFVQWGISSDPGGVWNGKHYYGITEWLWKRSQATAQEYKSIANSFNPVEFEADEWVGLAVDAGARYMVVAAKHHDGFALFDSAVSKFDIVDATPFGRDPLAEIAAEAKNQGMKLGFYYSQFQDWEHPDGGGNDWEYDAVTQDFARYQREKAVPQIKELLTQYGDVSLIWFDTPGSSTKDDAKQFVDLVRDHQQNTLISSRIGHGLGDYQNYRDSEIPFRHVSPKPWEAIFPHNESWGYSKLDTDFKSTTELLHMLAHTASKGGNLLVSVGPNGQGRIPEGSTKRLRAVGKWLSKNGESIYGTQSATMGQLPWGVATRHADKLYLHVLHSPRSEKLFVPNIAKTVLDVRLLASGLPLEWRKIGSHVEIQLPHPLPDMRNTVVEVRTQGIAEKLFSSAELYFVDRQHERIELSPQLARLGGSVVRENRRYWLYFGQWKYYPTVNGLASQDDYMQWDLNIVEPGEYKISLVYSADSTESGQEGRISFLSNDGSHKDMRFRVLETGEISRARSVPTVNHAIGIVDLAEGASKLTIAPLQDGKNLFKIQSVVIEPVD